MHSSNQEPQIDGEGGGLEQPVKILLGDIPAPRTPAPVVHPPARIELPPLPDPEIEEEAPSRLAPLKTFVQKGYFDPFGAFGFKVDWARFRKAQAFLFFLSLVVPFFTLLFLGGLIGFLYLAGASAYSATPPNPFHEVMLYPLIFVLARGYWIAYLLLPLGLFALGWGWALITAWILTRNTNRTLVDFRKALSILAMLGAMLAPFTLFPFLRLVAVAILFWYTGKRLRETFDISFSDFSIRGGLAFLLAAYSYGAFERKMESFFPASRELQNNINDFTRNGRRLEMPSFRTKIAIQPNERLLGDLGSLNSQIREQAVQKAMGILRGGSETVDFRFKLASRMSSLGYTDAMYFLGKYLAAGQGTSTDLPNALAWMQKFVQANPRHMEGRLEEARLLVLNKRVLDAKHSLVDLTKDQIANLAQVAQFIQKEGLGKADPTLGFEVQSLYQTGNTPTYYNGSGTYNPATRTYDYPTMQEVLTRKVFAPDSDKSLWFYRALVAEYGRGTVADPDVYGEALTAYQGEELADKVRAGDPVALDIAGDRCAQAGDVVKARQYWLQATKALNSDNRRTNVPFYLKLSESYDPESARKDPNPKEAVRYYLASLLISSLQGRGNPQGLSALKRLGVNPLPDPQSQGFLDLCLKYDVPEAWALMGDRHLNGDFQGVRKDLARAKDCFLKAQDLGYKGPAFFQQLATLDPAHAGKWTALAQGK